MIVQLWNCKVLIEELSRKEVKKMKKQKDVIILKCKECGEEFLHEYGGRGAKPLYCPECRKKVTMRLKEESKKKWQEKKSNLKKQLAEMKQTQEEAPVTSTNSTDYENRLIDILSRLDTLRVEMCNLSTELRQYQGGYDKNDQVYLHTLENINVDDVNTVSKFIRDWKLARNNRRNVKDLINILGDVIEKIPYKNAANAIAILSKDGYIRRQYSDTRRTNI